MIIFQHYKTYHYLIQITLMVVGLGPENASQWPDLLLDILAILAYTLFN